MNGWLSTVCGNQLGKTMYDKIEEDARSGRSIAGFKGPYGISLYSPRVADSDVRKNYYLRFESPIGRRLYEVAEWLSEGKSG